MWTRMIKLNDQNETGSGRVIFIKLNSDKVKFSYVASFEEFTEMLKKDFPEMEILYTGTEEEIENLFPKEMQIMEDEAKIAIENGEIEYRKLSDKNVENENLREWGLFDVTEIENYIKIFTDKTTIILPEYITESFIKEFPKARLLMIGTAESIKAVYPDKVKALILELDPSNKLLLLLKKLKEML